MTNIGLDGIEKETNRGFISFARSRDIKRALQSYNYTVTKRPYRATDAVGHIAIIM